MSLPVTQWYDGYRPTSADFKDAFSGVAPAVALAQANNYTDTKVAAAVVQAINASAANAVFFGGTQAFTRPDVTKITTVSIDVSGALTVTGATLCGSTLAVGSDASVGGILTVSHDAHVGGNFTATGTVQIGGQLAVNQGMSVQDELLVQGRISTNSPPRINGLSPYPNDAAAGGAGLVSGDVYFNTTAACLSVKLP